MEAQTTTATKPISVGARVSTPVSPSSCVTVVAQHGGSGERAAAPKEKNICFVAEMRQTPYKTKAKQPPTQLRGIRAPIQTKGGRSKPNA
ncbi:MAG: hypothetical protein OXC99_07820 [Chloroflexi bacterium]|nr:hypothetical protein [Chloroflexota bacterium]